MVRGKILQFIVVSIFSLLVLSGIGFYQFVKSNDGKLHVVFCNVGQGDGIFIKTPNGTDIVLDGGPDDKILDCLSNHLPFWDRNISLVLLSHPHADHLNGLIDVLGHYRVGAFATEALSNPTAGFRELENELSRQKKTKQLLFAGSRVKFPDGVVLSVLGPTNKFLQKTSPNGVVGESAEFASLILLLTYGDHSFLFTGDSQDSGLTEAVEHLGKPLTVFQIPHHGSKTGITKETLATLSPKLGIISVGKNKYGHPTKEVLTLLKDAEIKTLRTDHQGTIDISSDGKSLSISLQ